MMLMGLLTVVMVGCAIVTITRMSDHDAQQTALLPFADDPEAAKKMSEETGLVCDKIVRPVLEPAQRYYFEA